MKLIVFLIMMLSFCVANAQEWQLDSIYDHELSYIDVRFSSPFTNEKIDGMVMYRIPGKDPHEIIQPYKYLDLVYISGLDTLVKISIREDWQTKTISLFSKIGGKKSESIDFFSEVKKYGGGQWAMSEALNRYMDLRYEAIRLAKFINLKIPMDVSYDKSFVEYRKMVVNFR